MNFRRCAVILSLLTVIFLPVRLSAQDQADSCSLQISLLTCSPGQELYSTFGHSAFRVKDMQSGIDIIFNYGTFDFYDPQFYSKFVLGKLLYFVSAERYENFVYSYQLEGRGIIEQVLALSCSQKMQLFAALRENLKEENKFYLYDFLFDNCSTRLRDMLQQEGGAITFGNILPAQSTTFRNLIHQYLNEGGQYWSKLGIDLLLGARLDRQISSREAMFLPDYLKLGFDSARTADQPLVHSTVQVQRTRFIPEKNPLTSPIVFTSILLLLLVVLSFSSSQRFNGFLKIFDTGFFLITGLVGLFLLFMWFGTAHVVCGNNFNLLWANPVNLVAAFLVQRHQQKFKRFFRILSVWYGLVLIAWFFLPQEMNLGFLPLVLILFLRSWQRATLSRKNS